MKQPQEIETLRAEIERLRAALDAIMDVDALEGEAEALASCHNIAYFALAALPEMRR